MKGLTIRDLKRKKSSGEKIVMVSTYDYLSAQLCESAGVDCLLVGDSLGMVFQGNQTTLSVSLEETIYHSKAVRKGAPNTFLIVDMPFMSYQLGVEQAIVNCARVMKETGANAVKLEGGAYLSDIIKRLLQVGIPVVGHVGLTPQSVNVIGGYRLVGKGDEASLVEEDAIALDNAGAFMIIFESVPADIPKRLSDKTSAIKIGIGAGPYCDG
ncbi:MAG: 3-methyl-2-oxobutanoate hydroxymethyltransferase, partial [Aquificaceae bacterium]|nr:3-methyl-2-oxobutanoate hydroxymethyltransferase [Aquificaceae bacterium]MDW8237761.1 3-methyl-2-oxobutanoate hydroxymethyltransferase [Aquificaceae bacterium]